MSIFGNLGFNFDTNKFGDGQYLTPLALSSLNAAPTVIKDWQKDDMSSGLVSASRYLKNPHASVYTTLRANTVSIKAIADTTVESVSIFTSAPTEAAALSTACANFIIELDRFKSHTDNISGLNITSANTMIPNYDMAVTIGQQILKITNTTDSIANSTPLLGSFTSLFIGEELASNNAILYADEVALDAAASETECLYTPTQVNQIIAHITTANTMISTRRNHDWNFYQKSYQTVNDYLTVTRFDNLGNTQMYLVKNLIGTETLVNNLTNS